MCKQIFCFISCRKRAVLTLKIKKKSKDFQTKKEYLNSNRLVFSYLSGLSFKKKSLTEFSPDLFSKRNIVLNFWSGVGSAKCCRGQVLLLQYSQNAWPRCTIGYTLKQEQVSLIPINICKQVFLLKE